VLNPRLKSKENLKSKKLEEKLKSKSKSKKSKELLKSTEELNPKSTEELNPQSTEELNPFVRAEGSSHLALGQLTAYATAVLSAQYRTETDD
jgi:hypothetical protein